MIERKDIWKVIDGFVFSMESKEEDDRLREAMRDQFKASLMDGSTNLSERDRRIRMELLRLKKKGEIK